MTSDPIHIVFATNDNFCQHAAVAMVSLLENNKGENIELHLLTIDCSEDNIANIKKTVEPYNVKLYIYTITKEFFKEFNNPRGYSLATYLRLLTPSLLPNVDKIIYLDCDLVVVGNIREMWNIDIENYSCAGVNDATLSRDIVKNYLGYDYDEGYINAGSLVINLKYWRENNIEKKMVNFLSTHKVALNDQDAINIILHGTIKIFHPKWNCHSGYFALPPLVVDEQKKYIKHLWRGAKIVHFTGPAKPWAEECVNPYKKHYRKYRKLTTWKDVPLEKSKKSFFALKKIIILRKCKNFVARIVSWFY